MPTEWPSDDGGPFTLVESDLERLRETYPDGQLFLPDGLEDLLEAPASNGFTTAVPWQYVVTTAVFQRGRPIAQEITIRGMTLVQGEGEQAQFRRYINWAEVWAQLGTSGVRGEFDEDEPPSFLDPNGREIDPPP
jgi:hypothetical protein